MRQTLDPVDVGRPLADQPVPFAVRATKVFLLDAWNDHHGADVTLTAAPGDQRVKQGLDIDAIGLHPACPAVDLQAGWLHDETVNATLLEEARQPKSVIARLVAERHRGRLTHNLGQAFARPAIVYG